MTSMTTLFYVGPAPEEYVEFNESFGSKAFLEHVWNSRETPLQQSELAGSRLHSAKARISKGDPPRIEFPTILRIKGRGNAYKFSGRWISWDELSAKNPLAVKSPPSLEEFISRGGKVGEGKAISPGGWLGADNALSALKQKGVTESGSKESRTDDGWIGTGSKESVYAPRALPLPTEDAPPAWPGGQPVASLSPPKATAGLASTATSSPSKGKGTSQIEAMLERLRSARTGLGSGASKWASPGAAIETLKRETDKEPSLATTSSAADSLNTERTPVASKSKRDEPDSKSADVPVSSSQSERPPPVSKKLASDQSAIGPSRDVNNKTDDNEALKGTASLATRVGEEEKAATEDGPDVSIVQADDPSPSRPTRKEKKRGRRGDKHVKNTSPHASSRAAEPKSHNIPADHAEPAATNVAAAGEPEPKIQSEPSAESGIKPLSQQDQSAISRNDENNTSDKTLDPVVGTSDTQVEAKIDQEEKEDKETSVTTQLTASHSDLPHISWADDFDDDDLPDLQDWGISLPKSSDQAQAADHSDPPIRAKGSEENKPAQPSRRMDTAEEGSWRRKTLPTESVQGPRGDHEVLPRSTSPPPVRVSLKGSAAAASIKAHLTPGSTSRKAHSSEVEAESRFGHRLKPADDSLIRKPVVELKIRGKASAADLTGNSATEKVQADPPSRGGISILGRAQRERASAPVATPPTGPSQKPANKNAGKELFSDDSVPLGRSHHPQPAHNEHQSAESPASRRGYNAVYANSPARHGGPHRNKNHMNAPTHSASKPERPAHQRPRVAPDRGTFARLAGGIIGAPGAGPGAAARSRASPA